MRVKNIYKTNIIFAFVYFIAISSSTVGATLIGNVNPNNLEIRTILCFIFSAIILFISMENYKNQRNNYDKIINSIFVKISIILFYIYILFSCVFYVYETISITAKNGAYAMALGALIILQSINNTIKKYN